MLVFNMLLRNSLSYTAECYFTKFLKPSKRWKRQLSNLELIIFHSFEICCFQKFDSLGMHVFDSRCSESPHYTTQTMQRLVLTRRLSVG